MDDRARVPALVVGREWLRIGLTGFGGPPAHIAMLRELVVERRRWMDARSFEDADAACQLLPGPASTQLALFCAQRVAGVGGLLLGGAGFVVPAVALVLALAFAFLADAPPTWIRGAGAGAGARRSRSPRTPASGSCAPGGTGRPRPGRDGGGGWPMCSPAWPPRSCWGRCWCWRCSGRAPSSSRAAAGRGRGRACSAPRRRSWPPPVLGSYGRPSGRRPLLRRRVRDHPADAQRRRRHPRLDDRRRLPERGPAAAGAVLGSAVVLCASLAQPWQLAVAVGAGVVLFGLRRGVVLALVGGGAVGAVLAVAGAPL